MSKPSTSQSNSQNSRPDRDRSRGRRRPYTARGKNYHHPAQQNKSVQQPSESKQVYDWFDQELRNVQPDENQKLSDSRSSTPTSQSSGRSDYRKKGDRRDRRDPHRSTQTNQEDKSSSRYFKFFQLMRLSKLNGNDIATELSDNSEFVILLNTEMKNDVLVMTLRALAKLAQADFTRIVINIMSDVCKSSFSNNLERYLVALPLDTRANIKANKFYWEDVNQFWNQLLDFFKIMIDLLPMEAHDKILTILKCTRHYVLESLIKNAEHKIDEDIPPRLRKLYYRLKEKTEKSCQGAGNEMLQDFRTLDIIPTVEDLNDYHPYIRPCKVHGAYESVDHYLDVQFRLLREDFICPLRTGIQEYKKLADTNVRPSKISDIRIFEKVKIIGPTVVKNKIGVTISFGKIQKMNWTRSKLFMYGSLLCLTNDNFKSVLFATVVERDPQLLEKGKLIIEPCVGSQITQDMYSSEYVMVESKVYFLPYYHTLRSLRYMSEDNFPMKRYVVDAESTATPPKYLDKNQVYTYKGLQIPVMDERRWPSAKILGLDEPQYEAFKCALLQELSVLHGPPGTGKTFMALQIASTLLANSSSWYNSAHPTPMIVVCLTNHALDQFLEGILSYTDSLVRIGEQSKNPKLAQYKLKAVRDNYFKDEKNKHRAWQRMTYYQRQLKKLLTTLSRTYSILRALTSNTSIVSPNVLRQYCSDNNLLRLNNRGLLTYLLGECQASVALEINAAPSESGQSVADDASDSEDECVDADDDLEIASVVDTNESEFTCLEMGDLDAAIHKCETEITVAQSNTDNAQNSNLNLKRLFEKLSQLKSLQVALQVRLCCHPLLVDDSGHRRYLKDEEWGIYCRWLAISYDIIKDQIVKLETEFQEMSSQLNDFKQMTDLEVMRNSLVVGLTTTGAARLHESLRALRSPIVIVEEAAEILEAHVICSLTEHCQQVILIGDHKQLRPKPATYELEIHYNLNISLFERIVKMRDSCTQLVLQHRMRPEIAELISPSIYEKLANHISVFLYPQVKGLEKNMFFINHENHELGSADNESMSNPYEVKFLLTFAKYILQQGYEPEEVTILCTYSGQLFKFKEAKKSMPCLRNVRVTTVDNYQGEENRIILLSLVRNNHKGNIGFLKTENRVCVALSRAREGFYIMGNMKNLLTKNDIWPKINKALECNNAIGDSLVLRCQIHTDQLTEIRRAADFQKSPNGGCLRQCDAALPCGHTCQKVCHLSDMDHENYICKEPCMNKCPNGHPCKLLCNAVCKPCQEIVEFEFKCSHTALLPCNTNFKEWKCATKVSTSLRCGHTVEKPCHRDASTYPCTHICKKPLPCGHLCLRRCHIDDDPSHLKYVCRESCTKTVPGCPLDHPCPKMCNEPCQTCNILVPKQRSCGHVHKIECAKDVEETLCTRRCKRELPCGHKCKLKCNLPCGNCEEMVEKVVPECGHEVKIPCFEKPRTAMCKGQCSRMLPCGHPCKALCYEPCTKRCEFPRPLPEPALCQHVFSVPCYKIEIGLARYADKLLQHCSTACGTLLPCGHVCSGTCGSCKQGRIHEPCRRPCNKILICGHKCKLFCKDICQPCKEICSLKCEHVECKKKCGVPCTPCQKPCSRQCQHWKCRKLCFEICDRDFCDEPCPKQLECGHPCIGLCGEPCPPLCRICHVKDLPIVKNDPKPRFVFLPACGHCIESNYLDWVWQRSYKIGIKVCPLCQTRITDCVRYTNQIKKECKNIEIVQQEVLIRTQQLQADKQKIINDIDVIEKQYGLHFPGVKVHQKLFESLRTLTTQHKNIGFKRLKDISTKLTISGMILQKLQEIPPFDRTVDSWPVVHNQMIMLLTTLPTNHDIPHQMVDDVKNELCRLHHMVQLCKFERANGLKKKENVLQVEVIYLGLLNLRKFTSSRSDVINEQLLELKKSVKPSIPIVALKEFSVRTRGSHQEDWYKCSKGHVYLTDCTQCPSAPVE